MQKFITINGTQYPSPTRGLNLQVATLVDTARNSNGALNGQKIGRDQYKIDALEWAYLPAEQWSAILQEFSEFRATVTFPDMVTGDWTTLEMYCGDRTGTPYWLDPDTGLPTHYIHCKVNIIDTGA